MTGARSAPPGQPVTFVELFFDLVFVFAVTELTGVLRASDDATGVARSVIIFWLLWWGWTQFTWSLNAADTSRHGIAGATLGAVLVAYAMATAVTDAFGPTGWWFALPYVALRAVGLAIYIWVASEDEGRRVAVIGFTVRSTWGIAAVLIGAALDPTPRLALWALAIVLDFAAAAMGGNRQSYGVDPPHFIERHALFVILALGESLIAVGAPVPGAEKTASLVAAALIGVALVCLLWWTYFAHIKPAVEDAIHGAALPDVSTLARDVYSLLHFPVLCGIVAIAAAAEEAIAHPDEPLAWPATLQFAAGLVLYVAGLAAVHRRASTTWLWHRLAISAGGAGLVVASRPFDAPITLAVGASALLVLTIYEELAFEGAPLRHPA